jgi:hypothetical protein
MITIITFMRCTSFLMIQAAYRLDRGCARTTALRLPHEFPQPVPNEGKDDENHKQDHPIIGNPYKGAIHAFFSFCSA